jgi:transposase-like protein
MRFPSTLLEFQEQFPDEESCWAYLRKLRWPDGFRCPRCSSDQSSFLSPRRLEQCRSCRYQSSVTAGTVFHGTRAPLRVWLLAIFFVARHKQSISARQLQRDTGLGSYQTAWTLLHKLRKALAVDPTMRLTGDVEVDEAYIGGPTPGWRGRGAGKTGIAIAVERRGDHAGSARIDMIPGATRIALTSFVFRSIKPYESTVFSDAWGGYTILRSFGVDHRPKVGGRGRAAAELLPWAHTVIGNLKTWLRGTFHGVSAKHLHRYLDEFVFRLNLRWREAEIFLHVLGRALTAAPWTYRDITADRVG